MSDLSKEQAEAIRRKESVLASGLYTPIPHRLYRERLPELQRKYGARDARDKEVQAGYTSTTARYRKAYCRERGKRVYMSE